MKLSTSRHGAALAVATLAVTGAIGAVSTTTAPTAEAAPGMVRVISHNIAKKPEALTKVIEKHNSARFPGPEVVFLQEVCQSMLPRIEEKLGKASFHMRRDNQSDCSDNVIGEVVAYTDKNASVVRDAVDFDVEGEDQNYGMACLNFSYAGRSTRACSTHLASGDGPAKNAMRLASTKVIRDKARAWNKDLILIAGDFNREPTARAMDYVYGVGPDSKGNFREITQSATGNEARTGRFTIGKVKKNTDRKVDYIFAWKGHSRTDGGWATTEFTPSNHRMLFGAVPLR
ncbi:endonuclease/exonuclease/phosphatase family protein [Knoellia sp. LjRoot47]|uniref:endonuclease/exonuclease/phosphatase family protein n=1 Tax=Knoellia sp. LjRoot47 TaxID=3342330 RepID=UPI003ED01345